MIYDIASREASAHSRRSTVVETFFESFPQLMEGGRTLYFIITLTLEYLCLTKAHDILSISSSSERREEVGTGDGRDMGCGEVGEQTMVYELETTN